MLHDFIAANREVLIRRAQQRVNDRAAATSTDGGAKHGIPMFFSQLADALSEIEAESPLHLVGAARAINKISDSAAIHGHDLLRLGLTVAQVVNGYGDVCQVVTELASETGAAISAHDFQVFFRCLDDAIAGAVTAYGDQRERDVAFEGTERLGFLAHELRNLLNTARLSLSVLKDGKVGLGGSTGAMLARSLSGIGALVDRSLAEVRLEAGPPKLEPISLVEFIEEVEISAALDAGAYRLHLTVHPVDRDLTVDADRHLLASAVSNLLQNAFKFSRPGGHVSLRTSVAGGRILIEVRDECGGLPPGKAEELFRPFNQNGSDRSGLGLGLSIALKAARANCGDIHVRDIPGHGCVFTIDLPRRFPALRSAQAGARETTAELKVRAN